MSKDTEYPVVSGLNEDVAAISFLSLQEKNKENHKTGHNYKYII